ncbi:MAG: hypothetical protein LBP80_01880 [Treponema sp.]|jgi:hypothetical protein|nr:hypothetical protein [Treponema sp.]
MKKVILYCLAFLMLQNSILFAQDDYEILVPKFIMKTTGFKTYPYQLSDGTPLEYKDIYTLTSEVPGNSRILKQAKPRRTVSLILVGVSLVSCLFQVYTVAFPNTLENPGFYGNMAAWTTFSAFGGSILAGMTYQDKIQKSVNNYNLYIMGIPVN